RASLQSTFQAIRPRRSACAEHPAARFGRHTVPWERRLLLPASSSGGNVMFDRIQRGIGDALRKLTGRGRLSESNRREGLEEVRRALLDADVNYTVANDFIERVAQKAVGQEVLRTINPSEQIVKIIYDELVALMGPVDSSFHFPRDRPCVIMLCGL